MLFLYSCMMIVLIVLFVTKVLFFLFFIFEGECVRVSPRLLLWTCRCSVGDCLAFLSGCFLVWFEALFLIVRSGLILRLKELLMKPWVVIVDYCWGARHVSYWSPISSLNPRNRVPGSG